MCAYASDLLISFCTFRSFSYRSKEDGDKDLQSRLAIKAAESSIKEESVHSHDPIPVVERSDGTVVNPLHDVDDLNSQSSPPTSEPSPSSTTNLVSSGSGKESPTSSSSPSVSGAAEALSSVSSQNGAHSPPESDNSSPVMISSSGLELSTSDLHSVSSVGSGRNAAASSGTQGHHYHGLNQHHGSSTSISSGAISSKDSVFTDRSSPQEPVSTTVLQRSKSTSPDGSCVPDSTTISTSSPLSAQQTGHGKMARTDCADLGYNSGSSSSLTLRDRLMSGVSSGYGASPMTRTDSNASSIVSNNPLSASSFVGSLQSHGSIASATGSAHSTFYQGGNGLDFMSAAANPTFAPLAAPTADQYSNRNVQYVQQQNQPITGTATTTNSNASFPLMHQQQMGGTQFVITQFGGAEQMTTMHSMGNGAPQQQFVQQSNLPMNGVGGVDPNNINSLPDWTPGAPAVSDFSTTSSSASTFLSSAVGLGGVPPQQQGVDPMFGLQTTGAPGFEYIAPSVPGNGFPQQEMYNPPPIRVAGSDMYNGSTAGS